MKSLLALLAWLCLAPAFGQTLSLPPAFGPTTTYAPTATCTGGTGCTVTIASAAFSISSDRHWLLLQISGSLAFTVIGTSVSIPLPLGTCSGINTAFIVNGTQLLTTGLAEAAACLAGASTVTFIPTAFVTGDTFGTSTVIRLQ